MAVVTGHARDVLALESHLERGAFFEHGRLREAGMQRALGVGREYQTVITGRPTPYLIVVGEEFWISDGPLTADDRPAPAHSSMVSPSASSRIWTSCPCVIPRIMLTYICGAVVMAS